MGYLPTANHMYRGSVRANKRLTRAAGVDKKVGLPRPK